MEKRFVTKVMRIARAAGKNGAFRELSLHSAEQVGDHKNRGTGSIFRYRILFRISESLSKLL